MQLLKTKEACKIKVDILWIKDSKGNHKLFYKVPTLFRKAKINKIWKNNNGRTETLKKIKNRKTPGHHKIIAEMLK